ncbi:MAG TPA: radical SAM protein [Longimicrobium sp.]|nr:radical SAM protein [Longimicrobium sp.]
MKPNLLCIVPPYTYFAPPLGMASILGYLKANGCHDFDFLDLRLWAPRAYAPTYRTWGIFGESYVVDIPDLPLVLALLQSFDAGRPFELQRDKMLDVYAMERGLDPVRLIEYLNTMDRFLATSLERVPDLEFIGFSVWTSNLLTTLMACAHLKKRRKPPFIVLGGPHVTESRNAALLALRSGLADAVGLGEGEETVLSLYEAVREGGGRPSAPVPGTLVLDSATGEPVATPRKLMRIQEKPLPDFSEMFIPQYQQTPGRTWLPFEISRGCTDKCAFCSEWVFWQRFRSDAVEHVLEQIEELVSLYGAEGIAFADSLLNGVPARLTGILESVLARGLKFKWNSFLRANVDAETAALIKRSGCASVFLGIESLDDETLKAMNKRRERSDNINALRALLEAGVPRVVAGFIPGFPADTREKFLASATALTDLRAEFPGQLRISVEPFVVTPGQPLFQDLPGNGLTPHPWPDQVLDIAPKYRPVTEGIHRSVTGPNQGVDRLGGASLTRVINGNTDGSEVGNDFFLYQGDSEHLRELHSTPLLEGWRLVWLTSRSAHRSGVIVSAEEWKAFGASMKDQPRSAYAGATASFLDQAAARHTVAIPADAPPLDELPGDRRRLSPFAVCREVEHAGERFLLLADVGRGTHLKLDPELAGFVQALSRDGMEDAAVPGERRETLTRLDRSGFLDSRGFVGAAAGRAAADPAARAALTVLQ